MKNINKKNVTIAVLSALVVILLFVTIYQNFFLNPNDKPPLETPSKDLVIKAEDYSVFDLEDVPFKFVVAKVQLSSNEPIDMGLDNFRTNENVILNSVDEYRKSLESLGYDLSAMEVTLGDLVSLENNLEVNLFIPIKSTAVDKINLLVSDSFQKQLNVSIDPIAFDLTNPKGTPEMLGKVPVEDDPGDINNNNDDEPVMNESAITFEPLQEIDRNLIFIENASGQLKPVEYPSVVRVYSSLVSIASEEKIGIEQARLTILSTDEVFYALNSDYVYQNGNNIIDDFDYYFEGYVIFEVTSSNPYFLDDNEPIKIEYKLIGQDEWIAESENQ
ncbi:MAG: hypothetical protein GX778_04230 [Erysipelothrix sp.]|nr:hypothetical protein [Erysipelothrix sp.]